MKDSDNVLIAKYMNWGRAVQNGHGECIGKQYFLPEGVFRLKVIFDYGHGYEHLVKENTFLRPEELEFNTNWNWLMPVIRKINLRDYSDEAESLRSSIDKNLLDADIDGTYKAVVRFIKYLETQK